MATGFFKTPVQLSGASPQTSTCLPTLPFNSDIPILYLSSCRIYYLFIFHSGSNFHVAAPSAKLSFRASNASPTCPASYNISRRDFWARANSRKALSPPITAVLHSPHARSLRPSIATTSDDSLAHLKDSVDCCNAIFCEMVPAPRRRKVQETCG